MSTLYCTSRLFPTDYFLDLYRHNVTIIRSPTPFCRFTARPYPPLLILPMILGSIRSFVRILYLSENASQLVPQSITDDVSQFSGHVDSLESAAE
jgi:hypothetical protein